jgi:hypothetical protein
LSIVDRFWWAPESRTVSSLTFGGFVAAGTLFQIQWSPDREGVSQNSWFERNSEEAGASTGKSGSLGQ